VTSGNAPAVPPNWSAVSGQRHAFRSAQSLARSGRGNTLSGMYRYTPQEAKHVLGLSRAPELERRGGEGDLIFKIETAGGRVETGHVIEIDGESSLGGVLLGGMPPSNEQRFVPFDEMIWIAAGFLE
jgi:hypothetical protein